jgi:putative transposase
VKLTEYTKYQGKILSATISRQADNWFISFAIEPLISFLSCKNQASLGVDVGSKALATLSNGIQIEAPKPLKMKIRRLRRLSRQLSKKQHSRYKGNTTSKSKNYIKQQMKVAKLHTDISNIRKDTLHKVTTFLTDYFEFITIEDLNIKGMTANGKLARTISDLGLYELRRQLEYKSKLKGNKLTFADRWHPSSKTCSHCGNVKSDLKLSDRVYKCKACGLVIDRDLNASINLNKFNTKNVPQVLREFTAVEMTALLSSQGLKSSIVEPANKHQSNLIVGRVG